MFKKTDFRGYDMGNFCSNCGNKLGKADNFCSNCGAKVDKSGMKQNKSIIDLVKESIEEKKAKEKEEEQKKLKAIDEIFDSEEIKSEIRKNNIDQTQAMSIKNSLKNKIINKRINMSKEEIRYLIKTELENARKARIAKEMSSEKTQENKLNRGGYCSIHCRHYYEEFFDSGGGIVGDFDSDGYFEYYCKLGHSISHGCYCEYYE